MAIKFVNGKKVILTVEEEAAINAEWAANIVQRDLEERQAKIDLLISYEINKAARLANTAKILVIEGLDDDALDAAIVAAGL